MTQQILARHFTEETAKEMLAEMKKQNAFLEAIYGNLNSLKTDDKTSLVDSINEIFEFTKVLKESEGPGIHNCLCRGKNLGNTFTQEQKNAIFSGTFDNMYVGDYWPITTTYNYLDDENVQQSATISVVWRIADFDYYLRSGDTECTKHHVILVPDTNLFTRGMNSTDTTEGAYYGSEMRTKNSGLARARALFLAAFGENTLLSHRLYLQNAVKEGRPSTGDWYDSNGVELMTEEQVYGGLIFDSGSPDGIDIWANKDCNRYTIACKQFNLFRHRPDLISNRQWFWFQNVVSSAYFADVDLYGSATYSDASYSGGGVRPAFALTV